MLNFLADVKSVMESVDPTDVYMTSRYDMHYDHAYFGLFGIEAIQDIQLENEKFQPTVHEAIIHRQRQMCIRDRSYDR